MNPPNATPTLLELAAHLGDRDAMAALGLDAPFAGVPFEEWAWQFCRWGRPVMVRAALVAARLALPVWEKSALEVFRGTAFGGSKLRGALDLVDAWLSRGDEPVATLDAMAREMRSFTKQIVLCVYEGLGDERAESVVLSAMAAVETAVWNDAALVSQYEHDPAELEARRAAGPALDIVKAFSCSCAATGMTAEQLRAELRRVLLAENP